MELEGYSHYRSLCLVPQNLLASLVSSRRASVFWQSEPITVLNRLWINLTPKI